MTRRMTPAWVKDAVVGATLLTAEKDEAWWSFTFSGDTGIGTDSFWRVRADGGILVTSEDDGHKFGLPEPMDAAARALSRLRGRVADVEVSSETADLLVRFEDGATLEVFNTSCGYESWHLRSAGMQMIGLGGGDVAIVRIDGTSP